MDLSIILTDIEEALAVAKAVPLPAEGEAVVTLASAIEKIISSGLSAYEAAQGTPYDLTKLQPETEI